MSSIWPAIRYFGQFVVLGLAAACIALLWFNRKEAATLAPVVTQGTALPAAKIPQMVSFADAVAVTSPAVVNIYADRLVQQITRTDPQVSKFTGQQFAPVIKRRSEIGAGVIASRDGYVITNLHIVNGAPRINVGLSDGRVALAQLVGSDPATDLAILKIDAMDLPTPLIGDSTALRVGDVVLAIGNPFGLGKTVTMGIVSATGRDELDVSDYAELIQTDAAINRGNSGGALIDSDGHLVGINTAVLDRDDAEGIGFAIPIETALDVMDQLIETGVVSRGWLGVQWHDGRLYQNIVASAQGQRGHVIARMVTDGPAHRAGLRPGDYVVSVNGEPVSRLRELLRTEANAPPGSKIALEFWRQGQRLQTEATLIQRPTSRRSG